MMRTGLVFIAFGLMAVPAGAAGPGSYVNPEHPDQALELRSDGTYVLQDGRGQTRGRWQVRGDQVVLTVEIPLRTDGDAIVGPDGKRWTRSDASAVDRARMAANEAAAIRDLRVIVSTEVTYQNANGGFFGDITCLAEPADCIPGYGQGLPGGGIPFLMDREMAEPVVTRNGYVFRFIPGKAVAASPGVGKRSMEDFTYTATPAEPGKTGVRGFAADGSGLICFSRDGRPPRMGGVPCDPVH